MVQLGTLDPTTTDLGKTTIHVELSWQNLHKRNIYNLEGAFIMN